MSLLDESVLDMMSPAWLPESYRVIARGLEAATPEDFIAGLRKWLRTDLWVMMRVGLRRKDMSHPWLHARCMEVQGEPDGCLDLWFRGAGKSSIITLGKTLQDILASHGEDPLLEWNGMEPTFGIFSHTRPIAKGFLRQIKNEMEGNELLKGLFPDVLWSKPSAQAPVWSEDSGIVVKRRGGMKESTVEAWGLVDGMPTSKHFNVLVYDDVVTHESVATPDMNAKTLQAFELSVSLGDKNPRRRMIGTRYSGGDTYFTLLKRGVGKPRVYAATADGTFEGEPVLYTREEFERKWREMGGGYIASAQLLMNPVADSAVAFKREWLRYYREASNWRAMNRMLLVDPASEKKRRSDYTAMVVVGRGPDKKRYLLDVVRDRLSLQERAATAFQLHKKWQPQRVGWEKYGMMADIEYVKEVMERENYRFEITELGGNMSKVDRINRLMPPFSEGAYYLPNQLWKTQYDGKTVDVVAALVEEELMPWPLPVHDDVLDAMSREFDMEWLSWPKAAMEEDQKPVRRGAREMIGSWMGM